MKHLLLSPLLFCCSFLVWSHGYVEYPASRSYLCKLGINKHCGSVQYEPQSIEGPKGFPINGPADGKIASAGITTFSLLDEQTSVRWQHSNQELKDIKFKWKLTAQHKTTKWEYFITKSNWEPNAPLTRKQFELVPFCKFERVEWPNINVEHDCTLPLTSAGYHVVLAVWTIDDTANAFYQAIDLDIN
ncbi:TPA: lytic polysaccharide monooxygenase [Providencia rettgeri]